MSAFVIFFINFVIIWQMIDSREGIYYGEKKINKIKNVFII